MSVKVSVVMPVYNTEKFVWEAIQSILDQTFIDFEFIIIDDGSSDNSREIIQKYAKKDKRIKALQNPWNKWISFTRNRLHWLVNCEFIAVMDSDDISFLDRLELQYNFLKKHNDYWAIGGHTEIIDEESNRIWFRKYSNNIEKIIFKKSPLAQPSVMFKKSVFEKVWWYDPGLNYGEDYDLWLKIYDNWYKLKNLDKPMLKLRIREWQTKSSRLKATIKNTLSLQKKYIFQKKYFSISNLLYWLAECILYILPSCFVLRLFKKIEYWK